MNDEIEEVKPVKEKRPFRLDIDDKTTVILCATLIALCSLWWLDSPETVISNVVTGLFGVAVGRAINGNNNP